MRLNRRMMYGSMRFCKNPSLKIEIVHPAEVSNETVDQKIENKMPLSMWRDFSVKGKHESRLRALLLTLPMIKILGPWPGVKAEQGVFSPSFYLRKRRWEIIAPQRSSPGHPSSLMRLSDPIVIFPPEPGELRNRGDEMEQEFRVIYSWACENNHIWIEKRTLKKSPPKCPRCGEDMKSRGAAAGYVSLRS